MYEREFEYEIIHAKDIPEEKLENYFDQSVQFIDNSVKMGGKCLIHCFAGLFAIRHRSLVGLFFYLFTKTFQRWLQHSHFFFLWRGDVWMSR